MARWLKRLMAMRDNPRDDWRYEQLAAILTRNKFCVVSKAGSHVTWKHANGKRVTIANHGTVKPAAVREVCAILRSMGVKI